MKGDDDTFVRVDAIINEAKKVPENKSLYIGNINYYHKPQRSGKWAVTYEVELKPFFHIYAFFLLFVRFSFRFGPCITCLFFVYYNFKAISGFLFWNVDCSFTQVVSFRSIENFLRTYISSI